MIEYSHLTKDFGSKRAVDDLTISIGNELFSLLGPNGAGKTTTLKMTVGIMNPTSGNVFIEGMNVNLHPEDAKSIISYIPDQPFSYPELTGREFIYFVGRLFRMEKSEIEKNTEKLIEKLEIGEWIDLPCKE